VDPRRYSGRIVITNREKQVYSHPRNGIILRDVGLGTELFFYTRSDNVYEVALPGNMIGWISESGTFQLDVDEQIKKTDAEVFVQTCDKFRGTSYLQGGMSTLGIDSAGILYLAMKINGIKAVSDLDGQFALGAEVEVEDPNNLTEDELIIGDVLFFSSRRALINAAENTDGGDGGQATSNDEQAISDGSQVMINDERAIGDSGQPASKNVQAISDADLDLRIDDAGIYIGEGKFLHASQHTGKVQTEVIVDEYYKQRLVGVRRYF
jgi:cell wall-associated NlpC family hydrolase